MNGIDAGSLITMLRSPGIDTRVWLSFAQIDGLSVKTGLNAGLYADLKMLPFFEEYTARVGGPYAGDSAGFYFPLKVGDTILAAFPYGDSAAGITIIARFNDGDAQPPAEFMDGDAPSPDIVLVAESEVNIRFIVKGAGNVVIEPQGTGKVGIGAAPGTSGMEPIAMGQQVQDYLNSVQSYLNGVVANVLAWSVASAFRTNAAVTVPPGLPPVPALSLGLPPVPPNVLAEKGEVK